MDLNKEIKKNSLIPNSTHKYIFCMNFDFNNFVSNVPFDEFEKRHEDVGVWKIKQFKTE